MEEDRVKHSLAVANKMIELNNGGNAEELFLLGYLHDIGYKFTTDGSKHNKVGGEILKNLGFKYWKEVYYHGDVNPEYNSELLKLLNKADMMIDSKGNDVGFEKRLEDIKSRYGETSKVFKNAKLLIEKLRSI